MKYLLSIIVLLSLLTIVGAEKVHEEWHPFHDFFTVGDDYYEVQVSHIPGGNSMLVKALLKKNQASFIITGTAENVDDEYIMIVEDCYRDGLYRYCIKNISLAPEEGGRSDEYGNYRHGTQIAIYKEQPDAAYLTVTRELADGDDKINVGKDERIWLTILNEGNKSAKNIAINETFDSGMEIVKFDEEFVRVGKQLQGFIPIIYSGREEVLSYTIRATDYVNTTDIYYNITYKSPSEEYDGESTSYAVPFPYTSSLSIDSSSVKTLQRTKIHYKMDNKESAPIDLSLRIDVPSSLVVNPQRPLQKQGNSLYYSGTLSELEQIDLVAIVESPYTGTYNFDAEVLVQSQGVDITDSKSVSLEVKNDKITPSLLPSKEKMRSGEPLTVAVYVKNEDDSVPYFDIQGWVGADWFNDSFSVENIAPDTSENVIFKTYYPPEVDEPTKKNIYVGGSFATQNGEIEHFSTQKEVIIIPKNLSVILEQLVNTTSVERGDEIEVIVNIENIADSGYRVVRGEDEYTSGLEKIFGENKADATLFGGEKRQFYIYKLRVPYDWTKPKIIIKSTMSAQGQTVKTLTKEITVTDPLDVNQPGMQDPVIDPDTGEIIPPNDNASTSGSNNQTGSGNTQNPPSGSDPVFPEEKGFIQKIIDFFANFFS